MSWTALWALLLVPRLFSSVQAQDCLPGYEWASNSLSESPCQVAGQIKRLCSAQAPEFNTLLVPPTHDSQNSCTCSGIYYVLVAACADCQGFPYTSWSEWSLDCDQQFPNTFGPLSMIIQGVDIPAWVEDSLATFLNMDTFDPSVSTQFLPQAQTPLPSGSGSQTTDQQSPSPTSVLPSTTDDRSNPTPPFSSITDEVTTVLSTDGFAAIRSSTVTIGYISSSTSSASPASNTDSSAGNNSTVSKSNRNLGAIVGGAVGGFLFLLTTVGLIVLLAVRRRKGRMAPSAAYLRELDESHPGMASSAPFTLRQRSRSNTRNAPPAPLSFVVDSQDNLAESLRAAQHSRTELLGDRTRTIDLFKRL